MIRNAVIQAVCIFLLCGSFFTPSGRAADITRYPTADSSMKQDIPATNFGGDTFIEIRGYQGSWDRRGIIRFDLDGVTTFDRAYLFLYYYFTSGPNTLTVGAHRIDPARDWVESEVTWNRYRAGNDWTAGGGDFDGTPVDTQTLGPFTGDFGWYSWDVTTDVDYFLANPSENFGWVIKIVNETSYWGDTRYFYSKEDPGSYTPYLLLTDATRVELVSFEAEAGNGTVTLSWLTASEIDAGGFNLWRSDSADGEYRKINPSLIPAQGGPTFGAEYSYTDQDLGSEPRYFYKLEDVDIHGRTTTHGPVEVRLGPICGSVGTGDASLLAVVFLVVMPAVLIRRHRR